MNALLKLQDPAGLRFARDDHRYNFGFLLLIYQQISRKFAGAKITESLQMCLFFYEELRY